MQTAGKMIKTAGFMVVATFAAKLCGLLRDSFIGTYFGTGFEADAYFAATKIPLLFFDVVIGGVISAAFIPVFNEYLATDGRRRAMEFASRFINVVLIITGLMCALGILFAGPLIDLITPGLAPQTKALAVSLSNILFPMIIFTGLAFSFVGILQSFDEFNIPAIISLVSNGIMILYLLIFRDRFGVTGLAAAMLIGWAMQALVQVPSLIRLQFAYRLDFHFADPGLRKTARMALPLLISTWVQPLGSLINMYFSSSLAEGSMSALEYANRIYVLVVGIFSFAVTNLVFPSLSRANASNDTEQSLSLMRGSLKSVSLIMLPVMVGFLLLSREVILLIYGYGAFDEASTAMTATALTFYTFGMLGYSYSEVLNKSFFAMQNSKIPMINAIVSIAANFVLSLLLSRAMGIGGLALGAALAATINAALNFAVMNRRVRAIFRRADYIDLCKVALAALIMGAFVYGTQLALSALFGAAAGGFVSRLALVLVPAVVGAVVYGVLCMVFRVSEVQLLLDTFLHKKER